MAAKQAPKKTKTPKQAPKQAPKRASKKRKPSFDLPAGDPSGADTGWVYRTDAGRAPAASGRAVRSGVRRAGASKRGAPGRPAAVEPAGRPTPVDRVVAWVSAPFAMVVLLALIPWNWRR